MLEFLRSWVINIVTVSIILVLFEILIPTGKIKKVVNLVSGFILLIAVINPLLSIKKSDFNLDDKTVADSFYIDKKEIEASSKVLEEKQMKQISGVYKKNLAEKIKLQTDKVNGVSDSTVSVEINEDYNSDNFGEIKKVYIELKKGKKQTGNAGINSVSPIKEVNINSDSDLNKKEKTQSASVTEADNKQLTELVKRSLNKSLELQEQSIVVTILK